MYLCGNQQLRHQQRQGRSWRSKIFSGDEAIIDEDDDHSFEEEIDDQIEVIF